MSDKTDCITDLLKETKLLLAEKKELDEQIIQEVAEQERRNEERKMRTAKKPMHELMREEAREQQENTEKWARLENSLKEKLIGFSDRLSEYRDDIETAIRKVDSVKDGFNYTLAGRRRRHRKNRNITRRKRSSRKRRST